MNPPPTGGDNSRGSALGAAEAASSEPPARPADDGASSSLSSMPTVRASNIVGPSGTTCDQQIPPRRTVVDWVQLYQSGHERRLAEARRQRQAVERNINELGRVSTSQETPLSREVRELQRTGQGRCEREIQHNVDALRQLQLEVDQMLDAKETDRECLARLQRLWRHDVSWLERELQSQDSENEFIGPIANPNRPGPPGDTVTTADAKGSRPELPPSSGATDDVVGSRPEPPPSSGAFRRRRWVPFSDPAVIFRVR
jgi:hypothetical protein